MLSDASIVVTATDRQTNPASDPTTHNIMVCVTNVDRHYDGHDKTESNDKRRRTSLSANVNIRPIDIGGHRWTFTQSIADVDPTSWGGMWID
ncbi:MAG: hypothetical protein R3C44_21520 [Chloroflexota bacterium]